jgi:hypothetical protein
VVLFFNLTVFATRMVSSCFTSKAIIIAF